MAATAVARRPDGTLMPGVVLNPGGRPKGLAQSIRTRVQADEIISVAVKILRGEPIRVGGENGHTLIPNMRDVQWAANFLSDRGWGLPHQHVTVVEGTEGDVFAPDALTREQRDELERLLEKATGAQPAIDAEIVSETVALPPAEPDVPA